MSEIPERARAHVVERSGGLCERCGRPGVEVHHRRRRRETSTGDPHAVENLLRLCRPCHAWAHADRIEALEAGVAVASTVDPAAVPVALRLWGVMPARVFLTPTGYGEFEVYPSD